MRRRGNRRRRSGGGEGNGGGGGGGSEDKIIEPLTEAWEMFENYCKCAFEMGSIHY